MNNQETIEILEELLNSVKTLGFRKTLNILKVEKKKDVIEMDDYDHFVLDTVTDEFGITIAATLRRALEAPSARSLPAFMCGSMTEIDERRYDRPK